LLLVHFDDVVVLHFESLGCVVIVDSLAIEEETKRGDRHSLTFTVALFQLAHGGCELDFEVDFAVVLADNLQANVLRGFVSSVLMALSSPIFRQLV